MLARYLRRRPPALAPACALAGLLLLPAAHAQQAATSLRSGVWTDASMWSTGSVPTAADAVTIAAGHTVDVPETTVAALTVETGASVQRVTGPDGVWTLTVTGNVVNRGTIRPFNMDVDVGYDRLALRVGGNVTNTGLWDAESTELTGANAQTLAGDGTFARAWSDATPASPLVAGSSLTFTNRLHLNGGALSIGGFRLRLQQNADAVVQGGAGGRIVSTGGTIEATGNGNAALWQVRVEGAVTLAGYVNTGPDLVFTGPLTIATGAVVQRASGQDGVWPLVVEGALVNRGTVRPYNTDVDVGYDRLHMMLGGDLTNTGRWEPEETHFTGTAVHTVRADSALRRVLVVDAVEGATPGGLAMETDLTLRGVLRLNGATVNLGLHTLDARSDAGVAVDNGRIVSEGATLRFESSATALQTVRIEGPAMLDGYVNMGYDVVFSGPLTIATGAVLQRASGGDGIWPLVVEGALVNRGTVRPYNTDVDVGYDRLVLRIGGDFDNTGEWNPETTTFTGTRTHRLRSTQALQSVFQVEAPAEGTPGELVAAGPLRFDGLLRLGPGTLRMDGHMLTLGGTPAGTTVEGGRIAFTSGALAFATKSATSLQSVRIDGNVYLTGFVNTGFGVVFGGDLLLAPGAVLQRASGGDGIWPLVVEGTLTNRGTVLPYNMDVDVGYDRLALHLGRGLANDGAYAPEYTRFVGPQVHALVQTTRRVDGRLELESPSTPMGEVRLIRNFGGVVTRDFLLADAAASGTGLDSVLFTGSGNAPPASFGNAVARTWTFSPYPAGTRAAFSRLTLRYTDATLGSAAEDSLHVYHSEDGGTTWTRISGASNTTRDAAGNAIAIANAPAYGTYALSSRATAVEAAPGLVVTLSGPERIRVGPPNTYLLSYENTGTARLGDFFLSLRTTGGIYIDHLLPSSQKSGTPQPIRASEFSTTGDNTYAVFWVEGLEPGQSRTMTAVLKTTADIQGLAFNPRSGAMEATVQGQIVPAIVAGAAIGLGGAAATGFAGDVATGILAGVLANPDRRTAAEQQAVVLDAIKGALDDWTGGPEKGMSTFSDHVAGKLGSKLGNPIAAAADLANNAGQLADATRSGQERMAAAARIPGDFTPGGPFGNGPGRQPIRFPDPPPATPSPVRSWDPNEKNGPAGLGELGFVTSLGRMTYQIKFENKKEASDAAYEIVIVDTLTAELDPETVVNGPTSHPIFEFSRAGNVLTWRAVGIELPPNITPPEGEGFVSFTVEARPNLPSGTSVANRAIITFDLNKPIVTNTHVNTLDLTAPVTALRGLAAETPGSRVVVRWSADDAGGAGARETAVYASRNGGPFEPVGTSLSDSLEFVGDVGAEYRFYALTTDAVGNAEVDRPALVTTRLIVGTDAEAPEAARLALETVYPNPARGAARVRFTVPASDAPVTLRVLDVLGREVAVLWNGRLPAGAHEATWEAALAVASGVYFVRLEQGRTRQVTSLVLTR